VTELTPLEVTNTATDTDSPANTLTYELIVKPVGAAISAAGVITWTPTEAQGPGTYTLTTVVTDDGTPQLSATNSFAVAVTEANSEPILQAQTNQTIQELTTLLITNTAVDADYPANALTYALVDPPIGALIDTNGVITWTPTRQQAPATNLIVTVATDDGSPPLSSTNTFFVFVTDYVPGPLFADDFTRTTDPGPLTPWVAQSGKWSVTGGLLQGGRNGFQTYAHAYLTNNWTNYSVQAQFSFPSGADGGGIGAYLDPTSGAHYGAWIYPEDSPGGSRALKLLKFQNWTTWGYNGSNSVPMEQVTLPSVGTSWHTLTLGLSNRLVTVSYDTNELISVTDTEADAYTGGGVCVSMWTDSTKYLMSVDNVVVKALTDDDSFVTNAPPPVIKSIILVEGGLMISWTTVNGRTYRVQFTESLENATWIDVVPDVLATQATATFTNTIGNSLQRFYRVLLVR